MEDLFYKIFEDLPRQGPGSAAATLKALESIKTLPVVPEILDVGCGCGMQTLVLAKATRGRIVALDNHPPFLDRLRSAAVREGVSEHVTCVVGDMAAMDFPARSFDAIWSEGAIYIMGFEKGLKAWQRYLRPGGHIAVSEITWLKSDPPQAVRDFFNTEYAAMQDLQANLKAIERCGYRSTGHFTLPESDWWNAYYLPLEEKVRGLRKSHPGNPEAQALFDLIELEIDIYRHHADCYGYVFYIMQIID